MQITLILKQLTIVTTLLFAACQHNAPMISVTPEQVTAHSVQPIKPNNHLLTDTGKDKGQHCQNHNALAFKRLHSKAAWLRQEILYQQWAQNHSPGNPFIKLKLYQRQAQARSILRKSLKSLQILNPNNHQEAIEDVGSVLLLLSPDNYLADNAKTLSNPFSETPAPQFLNQLSPDEHLALAIKALTPIINSQQMAKSVESALHFYLSLQPKNTLVKKPMPQSKPTATQAKPKAPSLKKTAHSNHVLIDPLDKAMQEGNLPELQKLLNEFDTFETLPLTRQLRIRALRAFLHQQTALLNEQADNLYQQGKLSEAKTLWQKLLKLTPDDAQLLAKINRVQTVLQNMEQLRQEQP